MRAVDTATIAAGTPGERLMERAGAGVADALERRWGALLALRVLVLAGGGNNGGDGFVAARLLQARGAVVRVALCADRARVAGDARAMLERAEAAGVHVTCDPAAVAAAFDRWDFVVDALLGTGAEGAPRGAIAEGCRVLAEQRERGARVVAVDLPTGVSSDDGSVAEGAVRANVTVTFGHARRGHWLWPGRGYCGEVETVDIGLVDPREAGVQPAELATLPALAPLVPVRDPRAHKGSTGRVLLVGGAPGMTGALVLAARAAARAGAGYVRLAAPASLQQTLASHVVEQMVIACGEDEHRALTSTALPAIFAEVEKADAVGIGPGLSRFPHAAGVARELASRVRVPAVIDADALNALSPAEERLEPILRTAAGPRVLTPHLGEMARLTGRTAEELEARRIDATRGWAQKWGAVVLLKGAPTVVAAPDGRVSVNPTGSPALATAGTGDVLTGLITALLAQGLAPFDAARLGAYAHGLAGEVAADSVGELGMLASDLLERIPRVLARIRETR